MEDILALGKELKLSQLADDTTIFLSNTREVTKAVTCIHDFSSMTGLKINLNKSV